MQSPSISTQFLNFEQWWLDVSKVVNSQLGVKEQIMRHSSIEDTSMVEIWILLIHFPWMLHSLQIMDGTRIQKITVKRKNMLGIFFLALSDAVKI